MIVHNGVELNSLAEIQALDETEETKSFLITLFLGETWIPVVPPLELGTKAYFKRQQDGVAAYFSITAELRLLLKQGGITREENRMIEDALLPVRDEIVLGQWRTALEKLNEIGVAGPVTEPMYDRFRQIFVDYLEGPNYID